MDPSDKEAIVRKLAGVLDGNRYPPSLEHQEAARAAVSLLQDKAPEQLVSVIKNLVRLAIEERKARGTCCDCGQKYESAIEHSESCSYRIALGLTKERKARGE